MSKVTVAQKRKLIECVDCDGMEYRDEQMLCMDNHGCNVMLVVVERDGELLGFTYLQSPEEQILDECMDLVPLDRKEIVAYEYTRKDGGQW